MEMVKRVTTLVQGLYEQRCQVTFTVCLLLLMNQTNCLMCFVVVVPPEGTRQ